MTHQKNYSIGDSVFTNSEGLGIIKVVKETTLIAHMLETGKDTELPKDMKITKIIMKPDHDIAVPFDLISDSALKKELARLANVKDVKSKKKDRKKSLDADTIVDKILEKARRGEKVDLSKL